MKTKYYIFEAIPMGPSKVSHYNTLQELLQKGVNFSPEERKQKLVAIGIEYTDETLEPLSWDFIIKMPYKSEFKMNAPLRRSAEALLKSDGNPDIDTIVNALNRKEL